MIPTAYAWSLRTRIISTDISMRKKSSPSEFDYKAILFIQIESFNNLTSREQHFFFYQKQTHLENNIQKHIWNIPCEFLLWRQEAFHRLDLSWHYLSQELLTIQKVILAIFEVLHWDLKGFHLFHKVIWLNCQLTVSFFSNMSAYYQLKKVHNFLPTFNSHQKLDGSNRKFRVLKLTQKADSFFAFEIFNDNNFWHAEAKNHLS